MTGPKATGSRSTATAALGASAVRVTRLSLGTAPLGGWPEETEPATALATVKAAWDAGLRFFDTAPLYGHGRSEEWLGQALRQYPREEFTVATKVGRLLRAGPPQEPVIFKGTPPVNPVFDFSYEGTHRSLIESLDRLELERVDVAHIHDPDNHVHAALTGAHKVLCDLRSAGTVRAVGAGANSAETLTTLAENGEFDCFLLAGRYTLLEQGALDNLLPVCLERNISLIAGGVFNSGVLIDPRPGSHYNYLPAEPPVIERSRRITEVCNRHNVPVKAAALQFPLGHPAVASVLTGVRTPGELAENVDAFEFPIPPELWLDLKRQHLLREDAPVPEDTR